MGHVLYVGFRMLDTGCRILDAGYWMLDAGKTIIILNFERVRGFHMQDSGTNRRDE